MRTLLALAGLAAVALVAAAFSSAQTRETALVGACAKGKLRLVSEGRLTIGADNPAFPPWFGGQPKHKPWKVSDPYSGQGYESAVAYAVARILGFARREVTWIPVPFAQSFRPGKKPFDFYITQVSYTPERDKAVDFSKSYYFVNQALVARKGTKIAQATSIAALRPFKLGAQLGTTSYDYIVKWIKPSSKPLAYDTNDLAVQALKNGQIDGIVVDLPTAFYVTAVQVPNGVIVGQFPTRGAKERFGMVFEEGNPLRDCVNKALDRLWRDGTLKRLQQVWLSKVAGAPVLT